MQYTITKIEGEIVTIEFENGEWAQFKTSYDMDAEYIDWIAGNYSSEYEKAEDPNPNLSVGDVRFTREDQPPINQERTNAQIQSELEAGDKYYLDLNSAFQKIDAVALVVVADMLHCQGQSALRDALYARAQLIVDDSDFNVNEIISALNDSI